MVGLNQDIEAIWNVLHSVLDPEVPVLSVVDLGIVREVHFSNDQLQIDICPTYSGCPALDVIANEIKVALIQAGYNNVLVKYVLDKPWTSDWITTEGKRKLKEYGIAPPTSLDHSEPIEERVIPCPICNSKNTELISAFGSTACKALFRCKSCLEPFDYFKCK